MFDPRAFLSVTERLLVSDSDEAMHRSAISRAYYAAFLVAREFLHERGMMVRPPAGKRWGSHERVIFSLGMLRYPGVRNVRKALFRLKKQRTSADYELDYAVGRRHVVKARQDAAMFTSWIDDLS